MSGTSMDGIDASIISSIDGTKYDEKFNKYYEYNKGLYKKISTIRDKIFNSEDLKKLSKELNSLEKEITLFHAKVVDDIHDLSKRSVTPKFEIVGFHGQTIFHNSKEKISIQLGDGKLLSQLTKKTVVYDFRQNDLKNGGQGAPLTPIFHKSLLDKIFGAPTIFINIGGITNVTCFHSIEKFEVPMFASDIGPGNCLIDMWVRKNSNKLFDKNGELATKGKTDKFIFDQFLDNFYYSKINSKRSLDTNDFDITFAKGLSLENGTATITDLTSELLSKKIGIYDICVCGGGRKNKFLINSLKSKIENKIFHIDDLNIDGDYIESQAFAFLAIRSFLGLPISFPSTTNCDRPCTGGVVINNS